MVLQDYIWPGLASYKEQDKDLFYGRDIEISKLSRLIKTSKLTVLYGPSGCGKTSLIQAGIFPVLRQDHMLPINVRISFPEKGKAIQSAKKQLTDHITSECKSRNIQIITLDEEYSNDRGNRLTLWEWLRIVKLEKEEKTYVPVFVFDQFEEVFTLGKNVKRMDNFLTDLGNAAENFMPAEVAGFIENRKTVPESFMSHNYKMIFSIREDYLAHFQNLKEILPSTTVRQNLHPVKRLNGEQALEAVLKPAPSGTISNDVAEGIVRFVASASQTEDEDNSTFYRELQKLEIEPAILSLVCQQLDFKRRSKNEEIISAEFVRQSRDQILEDFYENCMKQVSGQLRYFIEDRLLDAEGFRTSEPESNIKNVNIQQVEVEKLIDLRLLHRVAHYQRSHLELCHDVLTPIIQQSRNLRKQRLKEEEQKAQIRELTIQKRKTITWVIVLACWTTISVLLLFYAFNQRKIARNKTEEALIQKDSAENARNYTLILKDSAEIAKDRAIDAKKEAMDQKSAADSARKIADSARKVAEIYRDSAIRAQQKTQLALASNFFEKSSNLIDGNNTREAVPYLTEAIKNDPHSEPFQLKLQQLLQNHVFYVPTVWDYHVEGNPDKIIASHNSRYIGILYNNRSFELIDRIIGQNKTIRLKSTEHAVSLSNDGSILTYSPNGNVKIYSLQNGSFEDHSIGLEDRIVDIDLSINGKFFCFITEYGDAGIASLADGNVFQRFSEENDRIHLCVIGPKSKKVATTSENKQLLRVWNLDTGKQVCDSIHFQEKITSVSFSPDGNIIAVSSDNFIKILDIAKNLDSICLLNHDKGELVTSVAFSSDVENVVSTTDNCFVYVWDILAGKKVSEPIKLGSTVNLALFDGHDKNVVTLSENHQKLVKWRPINQTFIIEPLKHKRWVNNASFSPDGNYLATASSDSSAMIWDAHTNQPLAGPIWHHNIVNYALFSADSKRLISASWDSTVRIWDVKSGKPLSESILHFGPVTGLAVSNTGEDFISVFDNVAQVYNGLTFEPLSEPIRHEKRIESAVFSPDDQYIVTASWDNNAIVWDAISNIIIGGPYKHHFNVNFVRFSPDSKNILTISFDSTKVWNVKKNRLAQRYFNHNQSVNYADFNQDGSLILTASNDKTVKIWEPKSTTLYIEPIRLDHPVRFAEFSDDDQYVLTISGNGNGSVDLWDARTGVHVSRIMDHEWNVDFARVSPDENWIATNFSSNSARVFQIKPLFNNNIDEFLAFSKLLVGKELNKNGVLEDINLDTILSQLSTSGFESNYIEWILSDPKQKTIDPGSPVLVNDYIKQKIDDYPNTDLFEFEELYHLVGYDPLLLSAYVTKMISQYDCTRIDSLFAIYNSQKTTETNANDAEIWYFRSRFLFNFDNYKGSLKAIDKSIRLDSNNFDYYLQKANILRKESDIESTNKLLKKSLEVYNNHNQVFSETRRRNYLTTIAGLFKERNLIAEYEKVLSELVEVDKMLYLNQKTGFQRNRLAMSYYDLSYAQILNSKPDLAITTAKKGLECSDYMICLQKNLAHGLLLSDQVDKAKQIYHKLQNKKLLFKEFESFKSACIKDFEYFQNHGISNSNINELIFSK